MMILTDAAYKQFYKYLKLCILLALFYAVVAIPAPEVRAQGAPPQFPALCYGELTVNGKLAPVGTKVVAKVDSTVRGEITTNEVGWYGGPGLKSKLIVSGEKLVGKMVRFYISGSIDGVNYQDVFAWEEPYWGSGEVMQINLGVSNVESAPAADPPAVPVPNPLPPPTESPDDSSLPAEESADSVEDLLGDEDEELGQEAPETSLEPDDDVEVATDSLSTVWVIALGALATALVATLIIAYLVKKKQYR